MNIGKKLAVANSLMAGSAIIVALLLARTVESIDDEFEVLHNRNLEVSSLLEKIRFGGLRIVSSTSEYLLITTAGHRLPGKPPPNEDADAPRESRLVQSAIRDLEQQSASYRALVTAYFPDELVLLDAIEENLNKLVRQSRNMMRMEPQALDLRDLLEAKESFEEAEQNFLQAVNAALRHEAIEYEENVTELRESTAQTKTYIWAGLLGIAILVLVLGGTMIRSITGPLARLSTAIAAISKGKYTPTLETGRNDEIGRLESSFKSMSDLLMSNQQLQQEFVDQLEQKNSELERFTYTVSHDLKSPLVTVKGFLGMLEKDIQSGDSEAIGKDIEFLNDATDTMGMLLTDLLELSRIGRVINPSSLFPMQQLCGEVVNLLQGTIQKQQAEVTLMPDMPFVYADRTRIREVIQNLLENALKFGAENKSTQIKIYSEIRDGTTLFVVEDNGMGIDARYHEKVFALFERLDANSGGTGVGLALVKRIIETHGGEIWVESPADGEGSRFCFTLPHSTREQTA